MNRRRFLEVTATIGAVGLLAGCANSDANDGTPTDDEGSGSPTDDATETPTSTPDDVTTGERTTTDHDESIGDHTTTEPDGSGDGSWTGEGEIDDVPYEFSARGPECGQERDEADIEFDTDAGEVVVTGTISGSDLCTRARLADLTHDREESHLSIAVETVDRDDCDVGGQCITEIAYEGTFSFGDGIPEGASVSHDGQGVASAAHGSASVTPPDETTTE